MSLTQEAQNVHRKRRSTRPFAALAATICMLTSLCLISPAQAESPFRPADLQAIMRSLGFLDTLPHAGTIHFGVVYSSSASEGRAQATQVAAMLGAMPGPNSTTLRADAVAAENLAQTTGRFDALLLLPGSASTAGAVTEFIRQRHVISISNDPACVGAGCCVLMVRTANGVEIVLDTALAEAVGAHFSTVFAMMVKRK